MAAGWPVKFPATPGEQAAARRLHELARELEAAIRAERTAVEPRFGNGRRRAAYARAAAVAERLRKMIGALAAS
jgi:hypothetical protein